MNYFEKRIDLELKYFGRNWKKEIEPSPAPKTRLSNPSNVCMFQANGKAPARAYHSGTLYRHELWVFGGVYPRPDPQPDGCSNDIYVFNPMDESWYEPIVNGTKPSPRSGQVICYIALFLNSLSLQSHLTICQMYLFSCQQ